MAQKNVSIEGIGSLVLAKRKGVRRLKLSIRPNGQIRVSLPSWTPYSVAIAFARSQADWINKHRIDHQELILQPGYGIGPRHTLIFDKGPGRKNVTAKTTEDMIRICSSLPYNHAQVQQKARATAEKILKTEATKLLPQRLNLLADYHKFEYKQVNVRKLTARWGSCSSERTITLSYYLVQLPPHLQDYVMLHELVHTKHLNHGSDFWSSFELILPNAKKIRKQIKQYRPRLEPLNTPL